MTLFRMKNIDLKNTFKILGLHYSYNKKTYTESRHYTLFTENRHCFEHLWDEKLKVVCSLQCSWVMTV